MESVTSLPKRWTEVERCVSSSFLDSSHLCPSSVCVLVLRVWLLELGLCASKGSTKTWGWKCRTFQAHCGDFAVGFHRDTPESLRLIA